MRRPLGALGPLLLLALALAGCTSPFTQYPASTLPELRINLAARAYDSDGNGKTDGIALTLHSAQPPPPLVGSDVVIARNGDTNVTVWRCPEREEILCEKNKGLLSWDVRETVYIRGMPGVNRLNLLVRDRLTYNTTVHVEETRDTEVWAILRASEYDRDGNQTKDGIEISMVDSDKLPFRAGDVRVLVNKIQVPVFNDAGRNREFTGEWRRGTKLFVDGFVGDNRVELFLKSTRYDLGNFVIGE